MAGTSSATVTHMERIGVRELRQNASVYLRKVKAGESVEITERGRLVAVMSPPALSPSERLIAGGQVTLGAGTWADVQPLPADPDGLTLSEILRQMRDEERW